MRNKFPYNCGGTGSGVVCDDIQNSADESPLGIQRNTNRDIRYSKKEYRDSSVSAVSISAVFDLVRFTNSTKQH